MPPSRPLRAVLGAMLIRTIWSATEILTSRLPDDLAIRTAYVRVFLIGLTLQIVLQRFPAASCRNAAWPPKVLDNHPLVQPSSPLITVVNSHSWYDFLSATQ